jgi:hypothetical protein
MERKGEQPFASYDYEIKILKFFLWLPINFLVGGTQKKGGNYGDSGFFTSHQRIGFHTG